MVVDKKGYTKWKDRIDEAIIEVCWKIIQEPLLYFSEADVQQLLVEKLHGIPELAQLYPTQVPTGTDSKGKRSTGMYKTSLVHREYGAEEGQRLDVVILDPDDVREIIDVNLKRKKGEKREYLQPAYAFELGTEKTGNIGKHFESDIKKLTRQTKEEGYGYLIYLYKDATLEGRETRRGIKSEKKIEKFKKVVTKHTVKLPANIKMLAVLRRIVRKNEPIRGKCEIFNGAGKGEWLTIGIQNEDGIHDLLKKQLN